LASLLGHHPPPPFREATSLLNLNDNLEVRQDLILREILAGPPQLRELLRHHIEGSLLAIDVFLAPMISITSSYGGKPMG
jgi:hypothetical protein